MTPQTQYTYGFVVRAMFFGKGVLVDPKELTPARLVHRATEPDMVDNFPLGLTLGQAQYMLDHWDDFMPEEDIIGEVP